MIFIKSINRLSNGKRALTQTQVSRPKKLFLVEKLRKFLIHRCVLRIALSRKPYIKNTLAYLLMLNWLFRNIWKYTTKVNKTIGLLRKLQKVLPRSALMIIYKAFVRLHLDYGNAIWTLQQNISPETWI